MDRRIIGIIGAPGTGKTSLARQVSLDLNRQGLKSEYVAEYASRYIRKYGPPTHLWEQIRIFNKQKEWEDVVPDKVEYVVTDCPLYLNLVYAGEIFNPTDIKDVFIYGDLFKMVARESNRYHMMVYIEPLLDPIDDGTRQHLTKESQLDVDWRIKTVMQQLSIERADTNVVYIDFTDYDKRCEMVIDAIKKYK